MLQVENLSKRYGKSVQAVDGLNLRIAKGELFGFVGPNGAGKTTTMKIVAGLISADHGKVYVDGLDALYNQKKIREKIGYMPDFFGVYDNLKVLEYMEFYASLYGIEGKEAKRRCLEMLDFVKLSGVEDQYVDTLSRGIKQRLCLARSMVHNPQLLILDEPASGLDPRARMEMKELLHNLRATGKTIIISSHILPELAEICSSIGIMDKGKLRIKGIVEDIMTELNASKPLVMKFLERGERTMQCLKENHFVRNIVIQDNCISVIFEGDEREEAGLLTSLIKSGAVISSYKRESGNLEELFMQITGGEKDHEDKSDL